MRAAAARIAEVASDAALVSLPQRRGRQAGAVIAAVSEEQQAALPSAATALNAGFVQQNRAGPLARAVGAEVAADAAAGRQTQAAALSTFCHQAAWVAWVGSRNT